ncbi:MAG TPA: NAD(P)/FAD-dependent oxidoreductase [Anaerolineae bacterium]|nr:NAD(P)/FAD-dependent oxidoreductase [Anaerolineae bacterium]
MNIGIIGGGFAGMSAAYELGKLGYKTVLFERMTELGGLAGTFEVEPGVPLERGYHHWFTSDTNIVAQMEELGLGDRVQWIPSRTGWFDQGKIWNMVSPLDLMRLGTLPLMDRIRLGAAVGYLTYLQQNKNNLYKYERITASEWWRKYGGSVAWDKVWSPMFRGKFGERADQVPMVWHWYKIVLRIGSRRGLNKEELGYPRGSFQVLIDALEKAIEQKGGVILKGATVKRVVVENNTAVGIELADDENTRAALQKSGIQVNEQGFIPFDRIYSSAPSFATLRIVNELPADYVAKMKEAQYMGAVLLILKLKQQLTPMYWLNIADRSIPFVATIEQTNFLPPEVYNNKRIVYVSNYLDASSPYFQMSRDELFNAYLPHLRKLNPNFSPSWVEECWHFKEAAAQPVFPLNYSRKIPEYRTPIHNLYLGNTTQIYPEDRGTNYSVRLGQIITRLIDADAKRGGWSGTSL